MNTLRRHTKIYRHPFLFIICALCLDDALLTRHDVSVSKNKNYVAYIMTQHCVCEDSWFMLLILSLVYEGRCRRKLETVFASLCKLTFIFMITTYSTPLRKRRTYSRYHSWNLATKQLFSLYFFFPGFHEYFSWRKVLRN